MKQGLIPFPTDGMYKRDKYGCVDHTNGQPPVPPGTFLTGGPAQAPPSAVGSGLVNPVGSAVSVVSCGAGAPLLGGVSIPSTGSTTDPDGVNWSDYNDIFEKVAPIDRHGREIPLDLFYFGYPECFQKSTVHATFMKEIFYNPQLYELFYVVRISMLCTGVGMELVGTGCLLVWGGGL